MRLVDAGKDILSSVVVKLNGLITIPLVLILYIRIDFWSKSTVAVDYAWGPKGEIIFFGKRYSHRPSLRYERKREIVQAMVLK
jgi:hypothetical protein